MEECASRLRRFLYLLPKGRGAVERLTLELYSVRVPRDVILDGETGDEEKEEAAAEHVGCIEGCLRNLFRNDSLPFFLPFLIRHITRRHTVCYKLTIANLNVCGMQS